MLCRRHHRAVHEEGYRVERLVDGSLQFTRPDGRISPDVPSIGAPADPVAALADCHRARGLNADARTISAGWLGEPLDLGYAIEVLHPLAVGGVAR